MQLSGATVLVTGASRGIGADCARVLQARGARVLLSARDTPALAAVAAELDAPTLPADLGSPSGLDQFVAAAGARGPDALVHCAGIGWYGDFALMPTARIDDV